VNVPIVPVFCDSTPLEYPPVVVITPSQGLCAAQFVEPLLSIQKFKTRSFAFVVVTALLHDPPVNVAGLILYIHGRGI
jgi:hypothetical protein